MRRKAIDPRVPISAGDKSARVRVTSRGGEYLDASVIHVWSRHSSTIEEFDGPFTMAGAAKVVFNPRRRQSRALV